MSRDPEEDRQGWDIVVVVLVIHAALSSYAVRLGPRRPPSGGDPMTALGAVFFLFWGTICMVAPRFEARSILFRYLNMRNNATWVGAVFVGVAVWFFGTWLG